VSTSNFLGGIFGDMPSYMGGLLGAEEQEKLRQQAQDQGLLNLGLSLLAGSGRSPVRRSTGELVAQGLQAGQQAYRGAVQQAVQDKVTGLQLQQMQKQMQAEANLPEVLRSGIVRPVTVQQRPLSQEEQVGLEQMGMPTSPIEERTMGAPRLDVERLLSAAVSKGVPIDKALTAAKTIQGAMQPEVREAGGVIYERQPDGTFKPVAGASKATTVKKGESLVVTDFAGNTKTIMAPTQQTGTTENPFTPLIQGGVIHPSILPFANQLQRSFANMDEDTLNKSMERLTSMNSQALQREESRADRATQQGISNQLLQLRIDEAKAKQAQAQDGKPLPGPVLNDLASKSENAANLTSLANTFKDDYGGYKIDALGRASVMIALRSDDPAKKDFGQWWQQYDLFANQIRNQLFGSALTRTEAQAFESAMVTPGMSPTQIKANLNRQAEVARNAFDKMSNAATAQGYSKSAIDALKPALTQPVGNEQAPIRVNSKADYDRLPAGSIYIDPQGNTRKKGG
jgi:hypothetical protein